MRTSASTATYQSVRRDLTELNILTAVGGGQDVAFAAPCLEELLRVAIINLATQALDIDFDEIGEGIEVFVPDMLADLSPAQDSSGVARKIFEQPVFLRRELNDPTRPADSFGACVNLQVTDL